MVHNETVYNCDSNEVGPLSLFIKRYWTISGSASSFCWLIWCQTGLNLAVKCGPIIILNQMTAERKKLSLLSYYFI